MKLISLNEWIKRGKQLPGRTLLESEEDDIVANVLRLVTSPDEANYELAKQLVKGQLEEDNPKLYKKFFDMFKLIDDMFKQVGVYVERVDEDTTGNFVPVFSSTSNVKISQDMVNNGKLIFKFHKVEGYFACDNLQLETLEGCPEEVVGAFYAHGNNKIVNLIGGPKKVGGDYSCGFQPGMETLKSLEGSPETVGGKFKCTFSGLTSLRGGPKYVGGDFDCTSNKLTSLEGAPVKVGGNFICGQNELTSLNGAPKEVKNFICSMNKLATLEGGPRKVFGNYDCNINKLTSLKGSPVSVGGQFNCDNNLLETLEGGPKKAKIFTCTDNKKEFTEEDVLAVCKVNPTNIIVSSEQLWQ